MDGRANWTPPAILLCPSWQACLDAEGSLDDEASITEESPSSSHRQDSMEDVLLNAIFGQLLVFGGVCQESPWHENPLQKQVTLFHIHSKFLPVRSMRQASLTQ